MKPFKLTIASLALCVLISCPQQLSNIPTSSGSTGSFCSDRSIGAAMVIAGVLGPACYNYWNMSRFEKSIIAKADDIVLAFTPNSTIAAIVDSAERNAKFCRKAQLVKIRKAVITNLKERIPKLQKSIYDRREAINDLRFIISFFNDLDRVQPSEKMEKWAEKMVGRVLTKNPCESQITTVDMHRINKIVDSFLMFYQKEDLWGSAGNEEIARNIKISIKIANKIGLPDFWEVIEKAILVLTPMTSE